MTDLDTDTRSDLDLDAIEAALADPCLWAAPWTAHTFEIDCPCPGGSSCGSMHTCVEVEAREEYPHGAPGEPAEEGDGQCVVQISVPGLERFAASTARAIALLRNHGPALVARLRRAEAERDTLRAECARKHRIGGCCT